MRKIIMTALLAGIMLPGMASAQNGELRRDRQDVREEQRELRDARRDGDRRDIRDERKDVREARREYREDWRDYRRDHRDAYRMPAYAGPRNYRYRPLVTGYRFAPAYYGRQYWVSDPWRYRLPAAANGRRWIRYGNDVVLVNVRNGRVIEMHRDFFW